MRYMLQLPNCGSVIEYIVLFVSQLLHDSTVVPSTIGSDGSGEANDDDVVVRLAKLVKV